jgi:uncharacterized protein (UPF0333 family)
LAGHTVKAGCVSSGRNGFTGETAMKMMQKGQTSLEFVVICIVLLAIGASTVGKPLKEALNSVFSNVKTEVNQ